METLAASSQTPLVAASPPRRLLGQEKHRQIGTGDAANRKAVHSKETIPRMGRGPAVWRTLFLFTCQARCFCLGGGGRPPLSCALSPWSPGPVPRLRVQRPSADFPLGGRTVPAQPSERKSPVSSGPAPSEQALLWKRKRGGADLPKAPRVLVSAHRDARTGPCPTLRTRCRARTSHCLNSRARRQTAPSEEEDASPRRAPQLPERCPFGGTETPPASWGQTLRLRSLDDNARTPAGELCKQADD